MASEVSSPPPAAPPQDAAVASMSGATHAHPAHATTGANAADIIRSIDAAFAEASTSTIDAAREVEEARRNARAASEVARRFMGGINSGTSPMGGMKGFDFRTDAIQTNGKSPRSHPYRGTGGSGTSPRGFNYSRTSPRSPMTSADGGSSAASQRNVEDLVKLSLELDRSRQELESERMMHDETKSALAQAKAKGAQLEGQIERLLTDMETQREASGRNLDATEHELATMRMRVEAAEEDAQVALDIAKENTTNREQVEEVLAQCLEQMQELRDQLSAKNALLAQVQQQQQHHQHQRHYGPVPPPPPPPPAHPSSASAAQQHQHPPPALKGSGGSSSPPKAAKSVHFADTPTVLAAASGGGTGGDDDGEGASAASLAVTPQRRSLVASGREILYRSMMSSPSPNRIRMMSPLSSPSSRAPLPPFSSSSGGGFAVDKLTRDAMGTFESMSERRKRLKEQLESLNVDLALPVTPTTAIVATPPALGKMAAIGKKKPLSPASPPATAEDFERIARNVSSMLRASGKRMSLTGRWWTDDQRRGDDGEEEGREGGEDEKEKVVNSVHLETLARHYCTSVEVLVDRKQKEVIELESLCALWERGNTADGNV